MTLKEESNLMREAVIRYEGKDAFARKRPPKLGKQHKMNRTKYERGTSITWNEEEKHAVLWTCQKPILRKMEKLGVQMIRNDGEGKAFHIPKEWVHIRPKFKRTLTEDQKKALRDHVKSILR